MTVFWIVAVFFVIAALIFLIPPLIKGKKEQEVVERNKLNLAIYKDKLAEIEDDLRNGVLNQDQYDKARQELERSLLEDVTPNTDSEGVEPKTHPTAGLVSAAIIAIGLPVLAVALYQHLGGGAAAFNPDQAVPAVDAEGHKGTIEKMITQLKQRLNSNPDDVDGWVMLGRSYYFLKRHREASEAYAKAVSLIGETNPDLLADYADTLAVANGKNMLGKPYELVKKALTLQPFHEKSLWLAGTAAYQEQDYSSAFSYWGKLLQVFPPNSDGAQQIQRNLEELKSLMTAQGTPIPEIAATLPTSTVANSGNVAATGKSVSGTVKISAALKSKASPDDTVFIFARAASGPRMPLAILRKQVKDLPITFELNDSMAMNPAMKLSNFPEVVVGARISKSGNAMPQSGDLEGKSPVVSVGTTEIPIEIDQTVP